MTFLRALLFVGLLALTPIRIRAEDEVHNQARPKGQAMTMSFEEELRIGPKSGEDHHIWSSASVAPDANASGDIFVTDPGGNRIVQFDKDGKFKRIIGGQGEGPGEFQILSSFKVLDDQTGIAFDNMQVSVIFSKFSPEMKFLDRTARSSSGMVIQSAIFSGDAAHVGSYYMIPNPDGTTIRAYTGILSTTDFKPIVVLSETTLDRFNQAKVESPSWWIDYSAKWFSMVASGLGVFAYGPENTLYTAVSTKYEITRWRADGKKDLVVSRDYKPIPRDMGEAEALVNPIRDEILSVLPPVLHPYMTDNVVRKALEKAELPLVKQPVFWIVPMEDKGFLVIHDYDAVSGKSRADLFNAEGKFLGQAGLPPIKVNFFGSVFGNNTKMVFKNQRAYVIEEGEEGVELVRYRYKLEPATSK